MMMLLYPLEGEIDGYSRDQFLADCVDEAEKDIRDCFDAGAVRVSVDFTEGRLANKNDSRNPWTGKNMLQEFIDLNNRLFDRFSAEERVNIGIHTCPGGDCDSVHSKEVPYALLLEHMFEMNAGYFLIQCASEDDRESVYELCGRYRRDDADGVSQVCFMGVINPLRPEVETAEHVRDELVAAAKHIPVDRLGATDDCGFSPFSRDVKPSHGSPDFARDVAMQKISARLDGARQASAELGRVGARRGCGVGAGPRGRASGPRRSAVAGRAARAGHAPRVGGSRRAARAHACPRDLAIKAIQAFAFVPGCCRGRRSSQAQVQPETRWRLGQTDHRRALAMCSTA